MAPQSTSQRVLCPGASTLPSTRCGGCPRSTGSRRRTRSLLCWRTNEARSASERVGAREERGYIGRVRYPPRRGWILSRADMGMVLDVRPPPMHVEVGKQQHGRQGALRVVRRVDELVRHGEAHRSSHAERDDQSDESEGGARGRGRADDVHDGEEHRVVDWRTSEARSASEQRVWARDERDQYPPST